MMRALCPLLGLLLLAAAGVSTSAGPAATDDNVDLDISECRDQLAAFARLDLDCLVRASMPE